jgi:hypothetical protein
MPMSKPAMGLIVGAVLGFLDGASAWFSPEPRPLMLVIVVGSMLKGIGIGAGLVAGFILSSLAAIGQNGHYLEIVVPGMLVRALTGFVSQRYPQVPAANRTSRAAIFLLLAVTLSSTVASTQGQSAAPADTLAQQANCEAARTSS